ncbi:TIGR03943 family protein [Phormidium sp. LEGE 05292]|uniref:TIGR03943 family putative permease subunit n=1 Tax=[Phormidium] sp. LEGE 05292 TaxID=767427 RepID=UPI00187EEADB|nr:TIGR03943 family protein [Phormidium sp. LEGE 05292]MBE9226792.1 TIGR03943 family protein [Phormidium sp. LEGE 05292]
MAFTFKKKLKINQSLVSWLDVIGIIAWGILLLKYWFTDQLGLLIHPDYFWLTICGGFGLLTIGGCKAWLMLKPYLKQRPYSRKNYIPPQSEQHITLFPPGVSSIILITAAILGFFISPRIFTSQIALQRGVTDTLLMTRAQPKEFKTAKHPEQRTLIDWVRTLNVYPEPDAYTGQKAKVEGFVIHPPQLPDNYLLISRFVITCCAADAYPVGLPVKLTSSRSTFAPDTWLNVQGEMITETLSGKRQLVINANSITPIPEPKNPYNY